MGNSFEGLREAPGEVPRGRLARITVAWGAEGRGRETHGDEGREEGKPEVSQQTNPAQMVEQARQAMLVLGRVLLPVMTAAATVVRQFSEGLTKEQRDRLRHPKK
ncbi:MAG: hypothetical protein U0792_00675 [Gemmataceae bacterium]